MKKLNEQQENLLNSLPQGLIEGSQVEKIIMAAFCYCNNRALENGEKVFTIGVDGLSKMTGYGDTFIRQCVSILRDKGYIKRVKKGNGVSHKNSTYSAFLIKSDGMEFITDGMGSDGMESKSDGMEKSPVNQALTKSDGMESKSDGMESDGMEVMTNNNNNYDNNFNFTLLNATNSNVQSTETLQDNKDKAIYNLRLHMDTIQQKVDALIQDVQTLKEENAKLSERVSALEDENTKLNERLNNAARIIKKLNANTNTPVQTGKGKVNNSKFDEANAKYSTLREIANDPNRTIQEREAAVGSLRDMAANGEITTNQAKAIDVIAAVLSKSKQVSQLIRIDKDITSTAESLSTKRLTYTEQMINNTPMFVNDFKRTSKQCTDDYQEGKYVQSHCDDLNRAIYQMSRLVNENLLTADVLQWFTEWCNTNVEMLDNIDKNIAGGFKCYKKIINADA